MFEACKGYVQANYYLLLASESHQIGGEGDMKERWLFQTQKSQTKGVLTFSCY